MIKTVQLSDFIATLKPNPSKFTTCARQKSVAHSIFETSMRSAVTNINFQKRYRRVLAVFNLIKPVMFAHCTRVNLRAARASAPRQVRTVSDRPNGPVRAGPQAL